MFPDFATGIDNMALRSMLTFFDHLSKEQRHLLEVHLTERFAHSDKRNGLGVVYDVTRWCNQGCVLCCTNAKRIFPQSTSKLVDADLELNTKQVFTILQKVKSYAEDRRIQSIFIN